MIGHDAEPLGASLAAARFAPTFVSSFNMKLRIAIALFVLVGAWSRPSEAQSVIDASRRIDWSSAGIPGGIPSRTTNCATLNPGASAAQINSAIASCPAGQVVFLNAGTYNLNAGIDIQNRSNITLRGAGPGQTILVFSGWVNCSGMTGDICVRNAEVNYSGGPTHTASWTGGYAKDATQITLSNTTGLAVGSVLFLDQLNDSNTDTGSVWVCSTINVCSIEGSGGGGRSGRDQTQLVRVTAISGNTVSISPGLHMPNWRASQSPGAWWGDTTIKAVGIEDMTVDHTASSGLGGIYFFNAYNCWVKNVKSINATRNHVWLFQTAASVVRDSYFYGTKSAATQSYGVESILASDNVVENNILQHITAPIISNGAVSGGVVAYNYLFDTYYSPAPDFMLASNVSHGVGVAMTLHEGNDGLSFLQDRVHGTQNFITAFRNRFIGVEGGKTRSTSAIIVNAFDRFTNVVGNVLGTPGYHTQYEWNMSGSNVDRSVYVLGPGGDPLTAATMLRWANYDTVTNTVQLNPNEVPSGLAQYRNPVPSSGALPPSLYLSVKPSWWGNAVPWPAVGPDVFGGDGPGGRSYRNPAHLCFDNTSKTNGILNFNANNCYAAGSSSGAPAAPTNLRIISSQ
jgi:hypothetical protein